MRSYSAGLDKSNEIIFLEFEREIQGKIETFQKEQSKKEMEINDLKQKNIIGNNEYMLLDIMLKNKSNAEKLVEVLVELQDKIICESTNQIYESKHSYVETNELIKKVKDETRFFYLRVIQDC